MPIYFVHIYHNLYDYLLFICINNNYRTAYHTQSFAKKARTFFFLQKKVLTSYWILLKHHTGFFLAFFQNMVEFTERNRKHQTNDQGDHRIRQ